MLSWAQRTARWTVKTLPFSFSRADGGDVARTPTGTTPTETPSTETTSTDTPLAETPSAGTAPTETTLTASAPAGQCPPPPENHGSRHRPLHERVGAQPARGRHAAPSRSRRTRTPDAG